MRQRQFLQIVDRDEAERRWLDALGELRDLGKDVLAIGRALGRVLAEDVVSELDVPGFDRANMDGWALRATDTYGASEQKPLRLRRAAGEVTIGTLPSTALGPGEAMAIPTGGALPRGADAVLQVESTELDGHHVVIKRAVTPGTAISHAGTDIARGEVILRRGALITSREIGVLAALGRADVAVRRRPRVGVLSTGDELVAPGQQRAPGRVHDANGALVSAAVREHGGEPVTLGIVGDDADELKGAMRKAIASLDMVILSGGTSKGPGDLAAAALADVLDPPGIVVHGVALKPGKPLCLGASGDTAVVVLPGFPTSAIFTFQELVAPLLRRWSGLGESTTNTVEATLPFRVRSDPGRREYRLVHLVTDERGERLAYPINKGSGSVTAWSHADGYFVIPRHTEHVPEQSRVTIHAMSGRTPHQDELVIIGSHCPGLEIVISALREQRISTKVIAVGSEAGLLAAKRGACDVAPIHLLDPATNEYNRPFVDDSLELVEGYGRLQGLVFRHGDGHFATPDVARAVECAVAAELTMINRNRGSGTRALYDRLLGDARPPGFTAEASSHVAVAAAIAQGRADWGIAIRNV
ncbi:MAG TPA: molybdopterin biosynthesis protein, partial [Polyangiaceae bacterium]|nr:molybdopterin biosynthesis protein [Polyangiaceae bacterium]